MANNVRPDIKSIVVVFGSLTLLALLFNWPKANEPVSAKSTKAVLVIHGGCGVLPKAKMTPELDAKYRAALTAALQAGKSELDRADNDPVAAVVAAVQSLEDSGVFNAGRASSYNHDGHHELDASVMNGDTRAAGAVAGVSIVRNPILAAQAVMTKTWHTLMVGSGADEFARSVGLEIVPNTYFDTPERRQALDDFLQEEAAKGEKQTQLNPDHTDRRLSTVGAVARSKSGSLAAATSSGGLTGKRPGRVGGSPIVGAGTFADSAVCAVSCTGDGEFFIRGSFAHEVYARIKYARKSLNSAVSGTIADFVTKRKADGAAIAIQKDGTFTMQFNTEGLYRGWVDEAGNIHVDIY